jgi:hypothetical protein
VCFVSAVRAADMPRLVGKADCLVAIQAGGAILQWDFEGITDEDAQWIAWALSTRTLEPRDQARFARLEGLHLSGNQIGDAGAAAIGNALRYASVEQRQTQMHTVSLLSSCQQRRVFSLLMYACGVNWITASIVAFGE